MFKIKLSKIENVSLRKYKIDPVILNELKNKKKDTLAASLAGRILIGELAKLSQKDFENFLSKSLVSFYFDDFYWSISHKGKYVMTAICDKPIGIDLEINIERDIDLFSLFSNKEWKILGEKNWINFYRGYVAKESAIKLLGLGIEDFGSVVIFDNKGEYIFVEYKKQIVASKISELSDFIFGVSRQNIDS